jgi:hypothetical protein
MNRLLILSSLAIFILEASASEVSAYAAASRHGESATAEPPAVQSHSVDGDSGVPCTTKYFVMTKSDGSRTIRKSVDCEE